jgi:hypothetical protein
VAMAHRGGPGRWMVAEVTWGQGRYVSPRVKDQVRRRDRCCRLNYPGCTVLIEEFDHPEGLADQGLQRTSVLSALDVQGVCRHCHAIKTKAQAQAGRARARAARGSVSKRYRDREQHPGTLA